MRKKDYRTLFLKEFTRNLIQNSKPKKELLPYHPVKQKLHEAHIFHETEQPPNMQFLPPISSSYEESGRINLGFTRFQENSLTSGMTPSIKPSTIEISTPTPQQVSASKPTPAVVIQTRSTKVNVPQNMGSAIRISPEEQRMHQKIQQQIQQQRMPPQKTMIPLQQTPHIVPLRMMPMSTQGINPAISSITPTPQSLPQNFNLAKIDPLIRDNAITAIECTGPGKPVIVKSIGRVSPTRVMLSESEIKSIIETFSKQTKIPMLEGMFKAAVGNLVITAVISDFVGSRFIINKYTPYSLIEGM
ncbi:MAG: hypothetical protein KKE50_06930 [Nanoarchaeota archaeon]|nr:hypothetical protein [Nanoarchaeota archaeon]